MALHEFLLRAARLKETPRRGWQAVGIPDPESVAEHAFSTAVAALVLAAERGLDPGKAACLALVHDIAEVETGDTLPGEVDPEEKRLRETAAQGTLAALLPAKARAHLGSLWREYAERATPEARLVRELDKLDMAVQAARYRERGTPPEKLARFRRSAEQGITDPEMREILRRLA